MGLYWFLPPAMALAAAVGLGSAMLLRRWGVIRPSFQGAEDAVEVRYEQGEPKSEKPKAKIVPMASLPKANVPRILAPHTHSPPIRNPCKADSPPLTCRAKAPPAGSDTHVQAPRAAGQ